MQPASGTVDLAITVTFDKPEYFVDEQALARAHVTNTGTAAATGVHVDSTGNLDNRNWDSIPSNPDVRVEPGQVVEFGFWSPINEVVPLVTLSATARSNEPDSTPADNTATVTALVKVERGGYTGIAYGERNGNTVMDPDEPLTGLYVKIKGGWPDAEYTATTDSTGRFAFRGLPRGQYRTTFGSDEWVFNAPDVWVGGVVDPDVVVGGTPWVARILTAAAGFDHPAYRLGDTALLTLTLTNKGSVSIQGVTGRCFSSATTPLDFGDLVGVGVTVAAKSTWAISLAVPIDARAVDGGALVVGCTFAAPTAEYGIGSAHAVARVPGARAARVFGQVVSSGRPPAFSPRPGGPIPNVKIYLRDQVTGSVITRATTDAGGNFEFRDVPAGLHDLGVVGPYVIVTGTEMLVRASEADVSHLIMVWSGPYQPDPDPAPQPGDSSAPPAAGPGRQPELAATGANVTWLALGGLLTLLAGLGLVVRTGRRRSGPRATT